MKIFFHSHQINEINVSNILGDLFFFFLIESSIKNLNPESLFKHKISSLVLSIPGSVTLALSETRD